MYAIHCTVGSFRPSDMMVSSKTFKSNHLVDQRIAFTLNNHKDTHYCAKISERRATGPLLTTTILSINQLNILFYNNPIHQTQAENSLKLKTQLHKSIQNQPPTRKSKIETYQLEGTRPRTSDQTEQRTRSFPCSTCDKDSILGPHKEEIRQVRTLVECSASSSSGVP